MNTLERSLIEKAGNDNGWEFVRESTEQRITLASLRHECEVAITPIEKVEGEYRLVFSRYIDKIEVIRGMPEGMRGLGQGERRGVGFAKSPPHHRHIPGYAGFRPLG